MSDSVDCNVIIYFPSVIKSLSTLIWSDIYNVYIFIVVKKYNLFTLMLYLKRRKIRLADKWFPWPDQRSVCCWKDDNVSTSRRHSRSPITAWERSRLPSFHLLYNSAILPLPCYKKAQGHWDASERGGDVCAAAGGLAGGEDGQVQHHPRTWPQLLDTCSGQGPVIEITL